MPNLHLRYGDGNNNGAQNTILFLICQMPVAHSGGEGAGGTGVQVFSFGWVLLPEISSMEDDPLQHTHTFIHALHGAPTRD